MADTKDEALERAIRLARQDGRIGENNSLVQLEEKNYGNLSLTNGLKNLQNAGVIDTGGVVEVLAIMQGKGGNG